MVFPSLLIEGPNMARFPWFNDAFQRLQNAWCQFIGTRLVYSDIDNLSDFISVNSKGKSDNEPLKKYEVWEASYRENPYLRLLSNEDVLKIGSATVNALMSCFLKGRHHDSVSAKKFMILWTHFFEEARERGLNLKGMRKYSP